MVNINLLSHSMVKSTCITLKPQYIHTSHSNNNEIVTCDLLFDYLSEQFLLFRYFSRSLKHLFYSTNQVDDNIILHIFINIYFLNLFQNLLIIYFHLIGN